MDGPALIEQYGYAALIVATFVEGEVALILASYAARCGYLSLPWVMVFAALGVLISDWTCFLLGRCCSRLLFARFPGLPQRVAGTLARIESNPNTCIIAFQFVPAASTITPIAIGVSRVSVWRFLVLDVIGVAAWTSIIASLGYLGGAALGILITDRYERWALPLVAVLVLVAWWAYRRRE